MIKAGIIGFGYMGHFHLERIKMMEDIEAVAVFDIEESKLIEAEEKGLRVHRSLANFLNDDLTLVIICTPNNWHAPYAIAALNKGKHVLCEKPATMSVKELDEVIVCAALNDKIFTVHQNRRWDVDYQVVCNAVHSGSIGDITTIESRVFGERGVCFGWRADPVAGGGMLYDWGVHLIDQMLQLFGGQTVISVYANVKSILTPLVDDYFELEMKFSGGICARIVVGTFALQKLPRWFVFGDRGTLRLEDFSGKRGGMARIKGDVKGFDSVVGKKGLGPSRTMAPLELENVEALELFCAEEQPMEFWRNLVAAINGLESLYVRPCEVLRQMRVVEAAFESSEKNQVIKKFI